jgi:CDP-diacylglycerol--glycerol-3-phosphate 3-phosphatidyltransferase
MNLPNKITLTRVIMVFLLFLGLFIFSFFDNVDVPLYGPTDAPINLVYLIVFVVFVIAASTDTLDGYLARKNNQITDLGKFLDPIADKMLVNATLIYLAVPQYFSSSQVQISLYIVILFIVRDLVVDSVRLMAARKNVVIPANIYGKLKTIFQMISIPVVLLNGFPFSYFDAGFPKGQRIADFLVYIALFFSLVSGVIYVYQNRSVFLGEKNHDRHSDN